MSAPKENRELRYWESLKQITLYQSPAQLRRTHEKQWGLTYIEALEAAYENMQYDARRAIKGRRRPSA
jgi:hypothetical protein